MPDLKTICRYPGLLRRAGSYWKYLRPDFDAHLDNYLPVFERYRNDLGIIPSRNDWERLPFGDFANDSSWQWRRQSLSLLKSVTGAKRFGTTLEIGAWNGWLTRQLAKQSGWVVAADYFAADYDGIGNLETIAPNISSVQCELEKTAGDFLPHAFDLIVLNHNLAYTGNPAAFINGLMPLLKPDGMLVSLGNTVFKNPEKKILGNAAAANAFEKQYGLPFYIVPLKGCLDENDLTLLKESGFSVIDYPGMWLRKLYSKINLSAPAYFALTYQKTKDS